jgi:hypothetical protein
MSGVEILSQTAITNSVLPPWYVWLVIISLAVAIVFFVLTSVYNDAICAAVCAIACIVLTLLIIFVRDFEQDIPTGRYQYRAKISNVNLNELVTFYDIIGQDGEVWILEDKPYQMD